MATHPLLAAMADRIKVGLTRRAITSPSRWARAHRIMGGKSFPGPWSFKHHPWLEDMHDTRAISNIGQKSAQMGFTEVVLNVTFYKIDIERIDCLYVLPAKTPDASDFSASRFDPALELSPYLSTLFSDVKNIGHKRAGATNLYIRGSRSRSGLKSIPAGFIVFDELAEMDQENIPLAMERASGQTEKQDWKISTPTIEDANINLYYKQSTMEHFFFPCPSCGKKIEFKFPDSIVITGESSSDPNVMASHYICYECKATLNHEDKPTYLGLGKWVQSKSHDNRGFHINQMYSAAAVGHAPEQAKAYLNSLNDVTNETEFFNSKLGLPHSVKGAQVTEEEIRLCIGNYRSLITEQVVNRTKIRTMGVDPGKWLNYEICEWDIPKAGTFPMADVNLYARPRVIRYGKVASFEALDDLMRQYTMTFCVIDANPFRREAYNFANRFFGRVKMCFYSKSASARQLVPSVEVDQAINVDRTSWLDLSLGRFHRGQEGILLPSDIDQEYFDQIKAQVREYLKDKDGNPVGRYTTPESKADHYGHSRNYCEIALTLAIGQGENKDIRNPT